MIIELKRIIFETIMNETKVGAVYGLKKKILLLTRFQRLRLHVVKFQTNDLNMNTASGIH